MRMISFFLSISSALEEKQSAKSCQEQELSSTCLILEDVMKINEMVSRNLLNSISPRVWTSAAERMCLEGVLVLERAAKCTKLPNEQSVPKIQ